MSILTDARQNLKYAIVTVAFDDVPGATAVPVLDLPQGATVVDMQVVVDTPFAGGTTHDIDIGDVTTADRYSATIIDVDGSAGLAAQQPQLTGYETSASEPQLVVTPTHTGGDPTSGSVRVIVGYVEAGRHDENFGDGVEFQGAPA